MEQIKNFFDELGHQNVMYIVFGAVIFFLLILDLGLFKKGPRRMTVKAALIQTIMWVSVATLFGVWVYFFADPYKDAAGNIIDSAADRSFNFFAAYVTEYSLSVDNIFVFIIILRYFKIEEAYHHKVLYYGVFGAMIFRAVFIFAVAEAIAHLHYILWGFGAFLIFTGIKMLLSSDDDSFEPENSRFYRILKRNLRMTNDDQKGKLVTRINGKLHFTTLFLVIALIEVTDVIFAVDSIPAVFSITDDRFVVYTSNIFAIMGLRSLFFLLEGMIHKFHLLQKGVSFVLLFIGGKMILDIFKELGWFELHISAGLSFGIILGILTLSVILSFVIPAKHGPDEGEKEGH